MSLQEKFEKMWNGNCNVLSKKGVPENTMLTKSWTEDKRLVAFWVEIPLEVIQVLEKIAKQLQNVDRDSFVPNTTSSYHISLKNLGILSKYVVDTKIQESLEKLPCESLDFKLKIKINGLNIFPVATVAQILDTSIIDLHNYLVEQLGTLPFEGPDFLPHISLGRFVHRKDPSKIISEIRKLRNEFFGEFHAKEIMLVKSYGYKPGSRFDVIKKLSLA